MSNCTNCYNGCTEIVSDRCVKYTGIDIPELGIQTGDTLSSVEQSITTYLVSVLNGSGVKIDLTGINVCNTVQKYLPVCSNCTDVSIADIAEALIKAACDLQEQIDDINTTLNELNADYTIECLTGVTASSDTHALVQAVINTLCILKGNFQDLLVDLPLTYVKLDDLTDLIQAYLNSTTGNLISNRMVPYAVVPYFGPIAGIFDSTGAGLTVTTSGENWSKVNLCNGNNGTPDLRGWGLVGVINGVPGGPLSSTVDPSILGSGNPNYSLFDTAGANQITLGPTQIPLHTHNNTVNTTLTDLGHRHKFSDDATNPTDDLRVNNDITSVTTSPSSATISASGEGLGKIYNTSLQPTGITANTTITNAAGPPGGGLPHPNIQPVKACYYIQYRPS